MSLEERFFNLFSGLDRAHGEMTIIGKDAGEDKVKGRHLTIRSGPTVDLWKLHLEGKQGLGVAPLTDDATVKFGAIDIDIPDIDHAALEKRALELGLPLIICKSKSGGAHCYLFMSEFASAELVRSSLMNWAGHLGHPGVEIFPKQTALANTDDDVGNWINMPYFGGTRVAVFGGKEIDADKFMKMAEACAVTEEILAGIEVTTGELPDGAPPCLEVLASTGIPDGMRNQALFNLAVMLKMKNPDDWEDDLYQLNLQIMEPPLNPPEVMNTVKSLKRKQNYFYTCNQPPLSGVCNKELCRQRKYGIGTGESSVLLPMIDNLIKRGDEPPVWYVHVDGKRLQLDTDSLMNYRLFRKRVLEKFSKILPPIKEARWSNEILPPLVENCIEEEAPVDASITGQLMTHVNSFVTRRQHADNKDDVANGAVFVKDEVAFFRAKDLMEYLSQKRFYKLEAHEVYAALHDAGADKGQFNIKGSCVRVWSLPIENAQKEEFSVPEIEGGDY